jgi:carboxymethylenebutenolidase
VTVENVRRDHEALFAFLDQQPEAKGPKLGLVGYCFSGAIVVRAAADFPDRVIAAASFHGGNLATEAADSPHLRAGEIRASLYFGYAADDPSLPPDQIDRLEAALRAARASFRSEHYAGGHGFGVEDSPVYEKSVGEHHWEQLAAHLNSAFEPAIGA